MSFKFPLISRIFAWKNSYLIYCHHRLKTFYVQLTTEPMCIATDEEGDPLYDLWFCNVKSESSGNLKTSTLWLLGASTVWVQPTCLPLLWKLIYELVFSSLTKSVFWFNAKLSMRGEVWLFLMKSDAKLSRTRCRKKKKRNKQRPFGQ